jgi:hypothetical protein
LLKKNPQLAGAEFTALSAKIAELRENAENTFN